MEDVELIAGIAAGIGAAVAAVGRGLTWVGGIAVERIRQRQIEVAAIAEIRDQKRNDLLRQALEATHELVMECEEQLASLYQRHRHRTPSDRFVWAKGTIRRLCGEAPLYLTAETAERLEELGGVLLETFEDYDSHWTAILRAATAARAAVRDEAGRSLPELRA